MASQIQTNTGASLADYGWLANDPSTWAAAQNALNNNVNLIAGAAYGTPAPLVSTGNEPLGAFPSGTGIGTPAPTQLTPDQQVQQQAQATQRSLVQGQLSRLPGQLQIANQNVLDAYNSAYKGLTGQKQTYNDSVALNRQRSNQGYQQNVDQVRENAGQGLSGIQRLLGSRGAGNSSAAGILAPYAVGRVANQGIASANDAFAQNEQDLNNNVTAYNRDWEDKASQLDVQRQNQLRDNESKNLQYQASLLSQNANPDVNTINALGAQIDSLGRQISFTPQTVTPQAFNQRDYGYISPTAPQVAGSANPGIAQQTGAFYNLLGQKDKTAKPLI